MVILLVPVAVEKDCTSTGTKTRSKIAIAAGYRAKWSIKNVRVPVFCGITLIVPLRVIVAAEFD